MIIIITKVIVIVIVMVIIAVVVVVVVVVVVIVEVVAPPRAPRPCTSGGSRRGRAPAGASRDYVHDVNYVYYHHCYYQFYQCY